MLALKPAKILVQSRIDYGIFKLALSQDPALMAGQSCDDVSFKAGE